MDQPLTPPELFDCRRCGEPCEEEDGLCDGCHQAELESIKEDRYRDYYE